MEPPHELVILQEKTERLLGAAVTGARKVGDRYEVPYQQTRIIVHPLPWKSGRTLLRFIAPIVVEVDPAPALLRRLNELNNATVFGTFYVKDGTIFIEHNLLGESVEEESFRAALLSVAHHADHLQDALAAEFGGRSWSEHA